MNLSKYTKESIVRKIMQDIPQRNFQDEADALVLASAIARLPAKVRALWNDTATRAFVRTCRIGTNCGALYVYVPSDVGGGYMAEAERVAAIGEECWAAFQALCAENRSAKEERRALERQIDANIHSVRTVKQFRERFPEFVRYLPASMGATPNLPATNDLAERLAAAGWVAPKQEQAA